MTKAWAFPSISSSSCSICGWKAVWGPSSTVGEGQAGACPWCVRHGVGRLCMCLCVLLCFIKQYRRRWCIGHRGLPEGSQHPNCTRRRKSFVAGYAGPSLFLTDHSRMLRTASWVVRVRLSIVPGQDRSRKASGQMHVPVCASHWCVCVPIACLHHRSLYFTCRQHPPLCLPAIAQLSAPVPVSALRPRPWFRIYAILIHGQNPPAGGSSCVVRQRSMTRAPSGARGFAQEARAQHGFIVRSSWIGTGQPLLAWVCPCVIRQL